MSGDWFKEWRESRWKQRVLRRDILDLSAPASVERLAAALEAMKHALAAVNEALDKNSYGDMVESALLEAHATLDSAILAALAEGER